MANNPYEVLGEPNYAVPLLNWGQLFGNQQRQNPQNKQTQTQQPGVLQGGYNLGQQVGQGGYNFAQALQRIFGGGQQPGQPDQTAQLAGPVSPFSSTGSLY